MAIKSSTWQWLILLALTGFSFHMADSGFAAGAVLVPVLLATLVKGRIVIDRFMGLQQAGAFWRWIVLGWLIVVLGMIAYAFRAAQG
ncbi:hypothetical protein EGT07_08465 [Herbaspirillum sp. HC18]|nr:hypothetical protein EGT07_08465 [Herbaspirillum sp. HC18]